MEEVPCALPRESHSFKDNHDALAEPRPPCHCSHRRSSGCRNKGLREGKRNDIFRLFSFSFRIFVNHLLKLMSLLFHCIGPCGSILQWTSPVSGIVIGVCWLHCSQMHRSHLPGSRGKIDLPTPGRWRIFSRWPSTSSDSRRTFNAANHAFWRNYHRWDCCRMFAAVCNVAKGKCFVFSSPMTLYCVFYLYTWPC